MPDSTVKWSALNEAIFRVVGPEQRLQITEIMYNPPGGSDYEFIELTNLGQTTVDASLMIFEGISFTFPANTVLTPGEAAILVGNADAFTERYPGIPIKGVYRGNLSNAGEFITLKSTGGQIITAITYDDERGWPLSADGRGDSLVLSAPQQNPNNPKSWQASRQLHGSPGIYEIRQ